MYDGLERRTIDRFSIPNAKVRYRQANGVTGVGELIDLSRSAARFEVYYPLQEGTPIDMAIELPNQDIIDIRGHVVWTFEIKKDQRCFGVAQFLPFGSDERYNPVQSLEKLKAIEKTYLLDQKTIAPEFKIGPLSE
jgi:hypothetical protein